LHVGLMALVLARLLDILVGSFPPGPESSQTYTAVLAIARQAKDQSLEVRALHQLGLERQRQGQYERASRLLGTGLVVAKRAGDPQLQYPIERSLAALGELDPRVIRDLDEALRTGRTQALARPPGPPTSPDDDPLDDPPPATPEER
jgi:hypothetical protein